MFSLAATVSAVVTAIVGVVTCQTSCRSPPKAFNYSSIDERDKFVFNLFPIENFLENFKNAIEFIRHRATEGGETCGEYTTTVDDGNRSDFMAAITFVANEFSTELIFRKKNCYVYHFRSEGKWYECKNVIYNLEGASVVSFGVDYVKGCSHEIGIGVIYDAIRILSNQHFENIWNSAFLNLIFIFMESARQVLVEEEIIGVFREALQAQAQIQAQVNVAQEAQALFEFKREITPSRRKMTRSWAPFSEILYRYYVVGTGLKIKNTVINSCQLPHDREELIQVLTQNVRIILYQKYLVNREKLGPSGSGASNSAGGGSGGGGSGSGGGGSGSGGPGSGSGGGSGSDGSGSGGRGSGCSDSGGESGHRSGRRGGGRGRRGYGGRGGSGGEGRYGGYEGYEEGRRSYGRGNADRR